MQVSRPGALTAYLEPLFEGGVNDLTPGSSCTVNVYTSNHERLQSPDLGTASPLHAIDTVGLVHAMILRLQANLLPVRTLVLSGGHSSERRRMGKTPRELARALAIETGVALRPPIPTYQG